MSKKIREKIDKGFYELIASLCLLFLLLLITSRSTDDIAKLLRFLILVIFIFAVYKLYIWLKKED
jgi:hypothetical protein